MHKAQIVKKVKLNGRDRMIFPVHLACLASSASLRNKLELIYNFTLPAQSHFQLITEIATY